jgi:hypothetical protein
MTPAQRKTWFQQNKKRLMIGSAIAVGTAALAVGGYFAYRGITKSAWYDLRTMWNEDDLYFCDSKTDAAQQTILGDYDKNLVNFRMWASMKAIAGSNEEKASGGKNHDNLKVWRESLMVPGVCTRVVVVDNAQFGKELSLAAPTLKKASQFTTAFEAAKFEWTPTPIEANNPLKTLKLKKDQLAGDPVDLAMLSGWTEANMEAAGWKVTGANLQTQKQALLKEVSPGVPQFRFYVRPEKAEDVSDSYKMVQDLCTGGNLIPDPLANERAAVAAAKGEVGTAQQLLKAWTEESGAHEKIDGVARVMPELVTADDKDQYKPVANNLKFKMPSGADGKKGGFIAMVAYYGSSAAAQANKALLGNEKVVDVAFTDLIANKGLTDTPNGLTDVMMLQCTTGGPIDENNSVNAKKVLLGAAEVAFAARKDAIKDEVAEYMEVQNVVFGVLQKLPTLKFSKVKALK